MESSIHHVANLAQAARSAVESLVGHPLDNDEMIYFATLGVQAEPTPDDRDAAWDELQAMIAQTQQNAAKSGLSSEQIDALWDAECAALRYDRRT